MAEVPPNEPPPPADKRPEPPQPERKDGASQPQDALQTPAKPTPRPGPFGRLPPSRGDATTTRQPVSPAPNESQPLALQSLTELGLWSVALGVESEEVQEVEFLYH